jgi:chromosome segregation protein
MSTTGATRAREIADKGGHFHRVDLQVHTPRDTQWEGTRPNGDSERKAWAELFVKEARIKGLHAVAISDHHDFAYLPYIKQAALDEKDSGGNAWPENQRLVIFPALELTLSVPCQAIMVLDADFPVNRLDDVLKALHFEPVDPTLDAIPQTGVLSDSGDINELHAKLDKNDWLRARYIILPNVTPSGHKTLLRTSFQAKYKEMISVGGYLDGSIAELDKRNNIGEKKILDGLDVAWGSKRLAIFQTSDARKADFSTLGQHASWVKWAEPTAEALRQACLAQESRISHTDPALPNVWISRVVVSQSKFMGRVDVALNPQYTALIGGRGTGKSTILDYLRWALCDQPAEASEDDEVADPRVRQRKLIEATLKPLGGHVEVHCLINGIPHVVRRQASDGSVQLKVGDNEYEKVRESNIQSLLPIQAYSQKQLSSVAIRVDELLRFVTSPIQRQLEDIGRRQLEVAGRLRENYGTLQRFRNLSTEIDRSNLRIKSLDEQAKSLRDGLTGISDEDRAILDGKSAHDDTKASLVAWEERLAVVDEDLLVITSSMQSSITKLERPTNLPEDLSVDVENYLEATRATLNTALNALSAARSGLASKLQSGEIIHSLVHAITDKLKMFDETYVGVKERSSAHEVKLAELAKLEEQQREARQLLQKQHKELESLGQPLERHKLLRTELADVRKERTSALAMQCATLSASSEVLLKATLSAGRGFETTQQKFRGLIAGSNVRGARVDELFENLAKETDPVSTWETVLTELESLSLLEADAEITSEQTPVISRLGLPLADQNKMVAKLTPDGWLDLSLAELVDTPQFEYRAKEAEYIPFASASAGQQASALLSTLLAHDGSPLIIDQPEDDLDSATVQQIVGKIWQSKSRRQLIFSSHNPNLVVNGDADLVLVCAHVNTGDQSAGHVKVQGAIDVATVRDAITSVMEGGERAFRLRKEKYGF